MNSFIQNRVIIVSRKLNITEKNYGSQILGHVIMHFYENSVCKDVFISLQCKKKMDKT